MNRQVVLEIGNTHLKAGFIEVSSLPLKIVSSWGKKDPKQKFFSSSEPIPKVFNDNLHLRALKSNHIHDFDFLIDLIENTLIDQLEIPRESFEQVQLTLVLPSNLIAIQLPLRSKLIKSLNEKFKFAGVFLAEVACMAAAGSNHGTALVLNFDREGIEVAAVNDFMVVTPAVEYFNHQMNFDSVNKDDLSDSETKRVVDDFYNSFVSDLNDEGLNLIDILESVLDRIEPDRRGITLNHIILNGILPVPYPLLVLCLQNVLNGSAVLSISDYPADSQPAVFSFRSIPEFYFEIKETGREHVSWFGATITGKYAHNK